MARLRRAEADDLILKMDRGVSIARCEAELRAREAIMEFEVVEEVIVGKGTSMVNAAGDLQNRVDYQRCSLTGRK